MPGEDEIQGDSSEAQDVDDGSTEQNDSDDSGGSEDTGTSAEVKALEHLNRSIGEMPSIIGEQVAEAIKEAPNRKEGPDLDTSDGIATEITRIRGLKNSGEVTEESADEYIQDLRDKRIKLEIKSETRAETVTREADNRALDNLNEYTRLVPALKEKGSKQYEELTAEYTNLVNDGMPNNAATQAIAAKIVLGPLDRLRGRKEGKEFNRKNLDTHNETGGGGDGGGDQKPDARSLKAQIKKPYWDHARDEGLTDAEALVKAERQLKGGFIPQSLLNKRQ